jgi:hypothetical protein
MTTAAQNLELAKPVTRTVYFVEFQFLTGTARLSTANIPITWGGYAWAGVGSIGSIGSVDESDGLTSKPLNFTINAAQPAWLALAVGAVEAYRGRPAKMYMCPLDESFRLVDTPVLCWSGLMDMVSVGINGESGTITLKCETSAYGLKRRPLLRLNAAQQRKSHPYDTGLDYLTDLIGNPAVWLSKAFQQSQQ